VSIFRISRSPISGRERPASRHYRRYPSSSSPHPPECVLSPRDFSPAPEGASRWTSVDLSHANPSRRLSPPLFSTCPFSAVLPGHPARVGEGGQRNYEPVHDRTDRDARRIGPPSADSLISVVIRFFVSFLYARDRAKRQAMTISVVPPTGFLGKCETMRASWRVSARPLLSAASINLQLSLPEDRMIDFLLGSIGPSIG